MVQPPFLDMSPSLARIFEPVVSFFTLQKATLHRDLYGGAGQQLHGEARHRDAGRHVRLTGYTLSVRPRGASDFVPEDQLDPGRATRSRTTLDAKGWSSTSLFRQHGPEITSSATTSISCSATTAPNPATAAPGVPSHADRIVGKVIYRYWPPASIGSSEPLPFPSTSTFLSARQVPVLRLLLRSAAARYPATSRKRSSSRPSQQAQLPPRCALGCRALPRDHLHGRRDAELLFRVRCFDALLASFSGLRPQEWTVEANPETLERSSWTPAPRPVSRG